MEDSKALRLFKEVFDKTRSGRIKWEPLASESDYFAALPGGSLSLTKSEGIVMLGGEYALVLRGEDEQELLRVNEQVLGVTSGELRQLFELAKRQVLRIDENVDRLLGELARL